MSSNENKNQFVIIKETIWSFVEFLSRVKLNKEEKSLDLSYFLPVRLDFQLVYRLSSAVDGVVISR